MGTGMQRARCARPGSSCQDSWRCEAELHDQPRPALRAAVSRSTRSTAATRRRRSPICAASPASDRRQPRPKCNLFQPGTMPGKRPQFVNFAKGEHAYNTDYNNFAPNVGFAWTPATTSRASSAALLGERGRVVRGGYTRAYSRNGMNDFSGQYNGNPGVDDPGHRPRRSIAATSTTGRACRCCSGRPAPASARRAFPATPNYPLTDVVTEDINLFDPNIRCRTPTPGRSASSVGIGAQHGRRGPLRRHALARQLADARLQRDQHLRERLPQRVPPGAGQPAARTSPPAAADTFAYTGAPGTAPLPTIFALLQRRASAQARTTRRCTRRRTSDQPRRS